MNFGTAHHARRFLGPHEHRVFADTGHNLPQERPREFARAVLDARAMALAGGAVPLVIRDARPDEFAAVGATMVAVYSGLEGFPSPNTQPDYYRLLANVGEQTAKPGARLLVALEKEQIAGAVVFYADMAGYGSGGTATEDRDAAGFRLLSVDPGSETGDREGARGALRGTRQIRGAPAPRHPLDRRHESRARHLCGARLRAGARPGLRARLHAGLRVPAGALTPRADGAHTSSWPPKPSVLCGFVAGFDSRGRYQGLGRQKSATFASCPDGGEGAQGERDGRREGPPGGRRVNQNI